MSDQEGLANAMPVLTPRQDRLEAAIVRVLRAGGTRSELRELVQQYADAARAQQIPPERAIATVKALAQRAALASEGTAAGDSAPERVAMMIRWCTARYYRAD